MFNVRINDRDFSYNSPTMLKDILRERYNGYAVAAKLNGRIYELTKVVDYDCEITPVDLTTEAGVRTYYRTLKFVFIMAVKRLYPKAHVKFMYGISRGQYCEIENIAVNEAVVREIEAEIQFIIKQNIPFTKANISREEAEKIYKACGYTDKVDLLQYRPDSVVHVYKCSKETNYLYGHMLPSTGYIREFKLYFNAPGIVILYPRHELGGKVPEFEPSVKFDRAMWLSERWGETLGVSNVSQLNKKIRNGGTKTLINMSEIRHENEIDNMADSIASHIGNIKLILIAGPSSSGKTTLSRRLQTHLATKGIHAIPISCDDYFTEITEEERNTLDLEHIERVDLELFNRDLSALIRGEEVTLPSFNFVTGRREVGHTVKLNDDDCIIVEGIHGLNERLTSSVPRYNKYKIYISALAQINMDDHSPISTTTCRLIRRIVRDNMFRGTSIEETLDRWQGVRNGEFRWIYPYQEDADYIFNSELTYELAVLKKHIMPLIKNIDRQHKHFVTINKIQKILKYIDDIDDEPVPCTSILREFIGGSNYV